ncbi:class I SAM-dependent methyltransferase [Bacillus sp. FSL K6-3431]|uniref:class I SAM-dependent methyltransferase n=1 Tax=Bacillus sp. FSL K6-3431 TaxID=2921500 RepID=UPI0040470149
MQKQSTRDTWNANLYDIKHSFVSKYGDTLVDLLDPKKGEKILDLGCGTGDLAKKLYDFEVNIIGVDKSENMVTQAMQKYPHIKFAVCDATELEYDSEFEAVFSNATLHWIKKPKQALHCIFNSLKPGGRFIAEFGGKGNVQSITDEISKQFKCLDLEYKEEQFPWYFPSIGEYSSLMEEVGFKVTFAQHFDRPTPLDGDHGLSNWIEMFCMDIFNDVDEYSKNRIIMNVEKKLKDILYQEGNWIADYKRIRVIGIKV